MSELGREATQDGGGTRGPGLLGEAQQHTQGLLDSRESHSSRCRSGPRALCQGQARWLHHLDYSHWVEMLLGTGYLSSSPGWDQGCLTRGLRRGGGRSTEDFLFLVLSSQLQRKFSEEVELNTACPG